MIMLVYPVHQWVNRQNYREKVNRCLFLHKKYAFARKSLINSKQSIRFGGFEGFVPIKATV